MAKLYFYYGSMSSSKTTQLVQSAYNYRTKKMIPLVLKPDTDNREGTDARVISRIGAEAPAVLVKTGDENHLGKILKDAVSTGIDVVMVDEVQFLSVGQIKQLEELVDTFNIPVMCYGLRNSFNNQGFESVNWLLQHADKLVEVKNICFCGNKATHNLMVVDGKPVKESDSAICVGGDDIYHSVCRQHFKLGQWEVR